MAINWQEAAGILAEERSFAESDAGLLKTYAAADQAALLQGQRLYAQAKAASDGLIARFLVVLADDRDPAGRRRPEAGGRARLHDPPRLQPARQRHAPRPQGHQERPPRRARQTRDRPRQGADRRRHRGLEGIPPRQRAPPLDPSRPARATPLARLHRPLSRPCPRPPRPTCRPSRSSASSPACTGRRSGGSTSMRPGASWSPARTTRRCASGRSSDGQLLKTLRVPLGEGNVGKVFAVAITPDGERIAAGGWGPGQKVPTASTSSSARAGASWRGSTACRTWSITSPSRRTGGIWSPAWAGRTASGSTRPGLFRRPRPIATMAIAAIGRRSIVRAGWSPAPWTARSGSMILASASRNRKRRRAASDRSASPSRPTAHGSRSATTTARGSTCWMARPSRRCSRPTRRVSATAILLASPGRRTGAICTRVDDGNLARTRCSVAGRMGAGAPTRTSRSARTPSWTCGRSRTAASPSAPPTPASASSVRTARSSGARTPPRRIFGINTTSLPSRATARRSPSASNHLANHRLRSTSLPAA